MSYPFRRIAFRIASNVDMDALAEILKGNEYFRVSWKEAVAKPDEWVIDAGGKTPLVVISPWAKDHVITGHADPKMPGSLVADGVQRDAVKNAIKSSPKGNLFEAKMAGVGEMGVAYDENLPELLNDEDALKKAGYFKTKDGRGVSVVAKKEKREPTDEYTVIAAPIGELPDGREVRSLVTIFAGGTSVDGHEIPKNRAEFAEKGFYFQVE